MSSSLPDQPKFSSEPIVSEQLTSPEEHSGMQNLSPTVQRETGSSAGLPVTRKLTLTELYGDFVSGRRSQRRPLGLPGNQFLDLSDRVPSRLVDRPDIDFE